ncbi:Ger(x)C family spore germination protein [Clostridium sp. D2Q-14]|uniref:Ger(x)C family spore germination protein n=1 Tax=Anaeromonas gelatinilytica TaxID=2683194 RepID=UPI00193C306B|nr:Ger(x)C family spore germination protein [Anaeromonas gelatinilytica]MBS4535137.1 Ger(x)C family spore germination protein [Anaeromonas gelatinilytica]
MKKLLLLLLLIITIFFNIACWDMAEIEERAYVTAIGIDTVEDEENPSGIKVTYEYPNLSASEKESDGEPPRFTICSEGPTLSDISREVASRMNKDIFFKHLKVIIVSEDFAKNQVQFSKVLKALDRSPDIGRKIVMLIADGNAKDVILTEIEENPVIGEYIADINRREEVGKGYFLEDLGQVLTEIRAEDGSFIIGRIRSGKGEIVLEGSSIIKDRKVVEKLNDMETDIVLTLNDESNKGKVTIVKDEGKFVITYIIRRFHVEREMKVVDGNIKFTYNIKNEGFIEEYMEPGGIVVETDIMSTDKIKEIEREINSYMEETGMEVINKLQNQFKTDVLNINEYIMNHDPKLWEEIKDDWDEEFSKIDFTININTKIRRIGLTE